MVSTASCIVCIKATHPTDSPLVTGRLTAVAFCGCTKIRIRAFVVRNDHIYVPRITPRPLKLGMTNIMSMAVVKQPNQLTTIARVSYRSGFDWRAPILSLFNCHEVWINLVPDGNRAIEISLVSICSIRVIINKGPLPCEVFINTNAIPMEEIAHSASLVNL